ncbi:helix-turn-helix transcriptional regulator [Neolewinella aurantiaca]|uniref:Helix-turn-helix transcriptional regulator n=1 Tax=Neolewinella aurantiaca TaxID=2602767 RepID=A0A5C7FJD4_9BACT|nr:helix-turn-helix transcriptional regulator [Neolewinella aurantiaca]TXF91385.1 helix-turn-helix transcriptional regulator [Neolewinella aurantiaca]
MARSKAYLFEDDEQLGSQLSMALAHPARFRMMQRLIRGGSMCYLDLIADIPLAESSVNCHLKIIKRLDFVRPASLPDGTTGYRLNTELYNDCILATRRLLRKDSRVVRMVPEEDASIV